MNLIDMNLSGKVAIVTGGSQGIGKAISLALAQYGTSVCIADIDTGLGNEVATQIKAMGQKSIVLPVDVTDSGQVTTMVEKAIETYGCIDILVNNAGGASGANFGIGKVLKINERDWDDTITLNLKSVFLCTQAVAKVMLDQKKGSIINIASITGLFPFPGMPAYSAAKAAVINLTKSLAMELAPDIRVNAIAPGFIDTPRTIKNRTAEQLKHILSNIPLERTGKPEEVANLAVYLASDAAEWVTGSVFEIHGGQTWLAEWGKPDFQDEPKN